MTEQKIVDLLMMHSNSELKYCNNPKFKIYNHYLNPFLSIPISITNVISFYPNLSTIYKYLTCIAAFVSINCALYLINFAAYTSPFVSIIDASDTLFCLATEFKPLSMSGGIIMSSMKMFYTFTPFEMCFLISY